MLKRITFLALACLCWPAQAEEIRFVTYHRSPPFITDEDKGIGLTYELARLLSDRSDGRFQFVVEPKSRPDLNEMLGAGERFVVPWVNPHWFKNTQAANLKWTGPIIDDGNAVIFEASSSLEYSGPESLIGKTVAGLRGGYWVGVDDLIKTAKVKKHDTPTYWEAMREVLLGRVDAAIVPYSAAKFLIARNDKPGAFRFASTPHSRYQRHFMISGQGPVGEYLDRQSRVLEGSPEWLAITSQYGL